LGGTPALSVSLLRQAGRSRRQVIWQNTLRHVVVAAARLPELAGGELDELLRAMERTRSEACLVVLEPEPGVDLAERARELTAAAADREGVRQHVEGYMVPLGVMRRRSDAYHVEPDPVRSPAVAELLRHIASGPRDRVELAAELASGPVGLSEPEVLLLLNAA